MYIALNPFVAGEFYAVYGDGSASWNFPTAWSADVTAVSRHIKAMPVPAPAPAPTKPQPALPSTHASMPEAVSSGGTGPVASGHASSHLRRCRRAGASRACRARASLPCLEERPAPGHASPVQTPGQFGPLASMPTGGSFLERVGFPLHGADVCPDRANSYGQGATAGPPRASRAQHITPPVHAPVPSTATGGSFPSFSSTQTHSPAQSGAAPPTAATGGTTSALSELLLGLLLGLHARRTTIRPRFPWRCYWRGPPQVTRAFSSGSTHAAPQSGHASPATGGTTSSYPGFSSGSTHAAPQSGHASPVAATGGTTSRSAQAAPQSGPAHGPIASTATGGSVSSSNFPPQAHASPSPAPAASPATSGGVSSFPTYTPAQSAPQATTGGSSSSFASASGGGSSVSSVVGHALEAVAEEFTPSDSPPRPHIHPSPNPHTPPHPHPPPPSPTHPRPRHPPGKLNLNSHPAPSAASAGQSQSQFAPQRPTGANNRRKQQAQQYAQILQAYQNAQAAQNSTFSYPQNDKHPPSTSQNIQASLPDFSSIQESLPDFSGIQASLPDFSAIQGKFPDFGTTVQEVVVSETVYDSGTGDTTTVVVDTTTWDTGY
ncbi:hypothetical protein B0H14DRAFT_2898479 [Mycena olivaceomarginata]|nr:hypothetical protein B0H14DRAFT_2898479 [Mycena olivaceomarginata]